MCNKFINTFHSVPVMPVSCKLVAGAMLIAAAMMSGCSGIQTFSHVARAGDTVALSVDRQLGFTRNDVVIQITDYTGYTQYVSGSDPSIRSWINTYPDPVSKMIVGRETNQTLGIGAIGAGFAAESLSSGGKDLFNTMVLLDLPTDLAAGGPTTIDVLSGGSSILLGPMTVEIIPGTGSPNVFDTYYMGPLPQNYLKAIERADHYIISFAGTVVPSAIQVDIDHNPDRHNGGVGQAYVTQPRPDINALSWTDDGSSLRVIITPAWNKSPEDFAATSSNSREMSWFDFYIAGGITGLQTPLVSAYDEDGFLVPGVTATIQ